MRVGVVGPVAPDSFAENVGDALQRTGHLVTYLGAAHYRHRNRLATGVATVARQALPSLDERVQRAIADTALEAQCEVVINLDAYLMPGVVKSAQTRSHPGGVLVPRPCGSYGATDDAARAV